MNNNNEISKMKKNEKVTKQEHTGNGNSLSYSSPNSGTPGVTGVKSGGTSKSGGGTFCSSSSYGGISALAPGVVGCSGGEGIFLRIP
jgi:hypothetical protein